MTLKYQAKGLTHQKKFLLGKNARGSRCPKIELSGQAFFSLA
jgi:hypothetical protein